MSQKATGSMTSRRMWIFCNDLINQLYDLSIKVKNMLLLSTRRKNKGNSNCQEKQKPPEEIHSPTMEQMKMCFDLELLVKNKNFKTHLEAWCILFQEVWFKEPHIPFCQCPITLLVLKWILSLEIHYIKMPFCFLEFISKQSVEDKWLQTSHKP